MWTYIYKSTVGRHLLMLCLQVIINTEWGAFGGNSLALEYIQTEYDHNVDAMSINAGKQM